MASDLPNHLKQSLTEADYLVVLQWWNSLSPEDRDEYSDISELAEERHVALPDIENQNQEPDTPLLYDYLVNHELRWVSYLADADAASYHKFVSWYPASLGSELRHRRGTVG
ncbi:MAG: hypothetical protein N2C14_23460 [Planctomycetales bacterium]